MGEGREQLGPRGEIARPAEGSLAAGIPLENNDKAETPLGVTFYFSAGRDLSWVPSMSPSTGERVGLVFLWKSPVSWFISSGDVLKPEARPKSRTCAGKQGWALPDALTFPHSHFWEALVTVTMRAGISCLRLSLHWPKNVAV